MKITMVDSFKSDLGKIDLSTAFENTKPLIDHHVETLLPFMYVKNSIKDEELPDEIRFLIPNTENSPEWFLDRDVEKIDTSCVTKRYVCLDNMPEELKSVIRNYLVLCQNKDNPSRQIVFLNVVRSFSESVQEQFNDLYKHKSILEK